jgi:hypothetical protein
MNDQRQRLLLLLAVVGTITVASGLLLVRVELGLSGGSLAPLVGTGLGLAVLLNLVALTIIVGLARSFAPSLPLLPLGLWVGALYLLGGRTATMLTHNTGPRVVDLGLVLLAVVAAQGARRSIVRGRKVPVTFEEE